MNTPGAAEAPVTSPWSMYRAIVGIGALCALLIVTAFQTTETRIRENRDRALRQAVAQVLPEAASVLAVTIGDSGRLEEAVAADADLPAFLGYDAEGRLIGAALTASGMGYQDTIRLLYAYSFSKQAIVGFKVLESKETPGLGDKVEKEPHFLANFDGLDVTLTADGLGLLHPLVTVAQGEKQAAWELDGITGATITSVAVGRILNESAEVWVPVLAREAGSLTAPEAAEAP